MPPKKPKPPYDWEAIEREYRAGQLSLAEITAQYGPAKSTISERAKRKGWVRDLSGQVRSTANARLLKDGEDGANADTNGSHARSHRSEDEDRRTVDQAAARVVHVVRGHRASLENAHLIVQSLFSELDATTVQRIDIEQLIDVIAKEESGSDKKRRTAIKNLLRQITSLPTRAQTVRQLTAALKEVIQLERQAFNIDDQKGGEDRVPVAERLKQYQREEAIERSPNVTELPRRSGI